MDRAYSFTSIGALAMVTALCVGLGMQPKPHNLKRIHDPRRVTYSIHIRACHTRDHGQLPDAKCTPGSIDPAISQANISSTICKSGWTGKVRPPNLRQNMRSTTSPIPLTTSRRTP